MKLLSGLFERKAGNTPANSSAVARAVGNPFLLTRSISPDWDTEAAVKNHYERVLFVFRCVDVIASNQANIRAFVADGKKNEVEHSDIDRLLNHRANTYETSWQFRYRLSSLLLLSPKGVFIEVVKSRSGGLAELHLLPPHLVEPIPDPDTFVSGYRVNTYGQGVSEIPPDRVMWLRSKPHPLDPYKQMTPLVAAGLATETDHLARLFNRNFLLNDGRPGLLVNIRGQMLNEDMEELRSRFNGGPTTAGQTAIIDGAEGIDMQDMGASPRDMAWTEAVLQAKQDTLLAFGVPESVMGNASGRTYDNAAAEKGVFWLETMTPHMNSIGRGLDALTGDLDDRVGVTFDYDSVPELQFARQLRLSQKADEVAKGLATIDDYMREAGREPWDVVGTRILINAQNVPIGRDEEDQKAADNMAPVGAGGDMGGFGGLFGGMGGGGQRGSSPQTPQDGTPGTAGGTTSDTYSKPTFSSHRVVGFGQKVLAQDTDVELELKGALDGVLTAWLDQRTDEVVERLSHAKARKGTRHWGTPDGEELGTKAIPLDYVVRTDNWKERGKRALERRLATLARREANRIARELIAEGVEVRGKSSSPIVRLLGSKMKAAEAISKTVVPSLRVGQAAIDQRAAKVRAAISVADQQGLPLKDVIAAAKQEMRRSEKWRLRLRDDMTRQVIEGVRQNVYEDVARRRGVTLHKVWRSEHDTRTRDSHRKADGQKRKPKSHFRVGARWMLFPHDPAGFPEETMNCRCHTEWVMA